MARINKFKLPDLVSKKLNTLPNAEAILQNLQTTIRILETQKKIKLLKCLEGGTSAFLAQAITDNQQEIIVKIPLHIVEYGLSFEKELKALEKVNGKGYVKLLAYDKALKVAFLEQLGQPLGDLGYSKNRQIEIICTALKKSWIPLRESDQFPTIIGIADWFHNYVNDTWNTLSQPFSKELLTITNDYIQQRKADFNPKSAFLIHGDAHNFNILQDNSTAEESFKLIDPDGIWAEPAYDLGVIMREWADDLMINPKEKLVERLTFLHEITGIEKLPTWQWGLIQCVATGLVLLQSDQQEEGEKLLSIGESWREVDFS